jgi:hypothetical protein
MANTSAKHRWAFDRLGGFDQVRFSSDSDWQDLAQLDPKLWAVLSCPTRQLAVEDVTFDLLDSDHDGRVRVSEVLKAVSWVCELLKSPSQLSRRVAEFSLLDLRSDTAQGASLFSVTRSLLSQAHLDDQTAITLAFVTEAMARFAQLPFNGDGVITEQSIDDAVLLAAFRDVMTSVGRAEDVSGQMGVDADLLDVFVAAVDDRLRWFNEASDAGGFLLGERTFDALSALDAVSSKINDFFTRTALVAFDGQAKDALNPGLPVYEAMYANLLVDKAQDISALPLAQVTADACLPLHEGINPAWQAAMKQFYVQTVVPILGETSSLSVADWLALQEKLAVSRSWLERQEGMSVAGLEIAHLLAWQASSWEADLRALIAKDLSYSNQLELMSQLHKLLLLLRDCDVVVNNFVSLRDFYSPEHLGLFEAGTLFLDGRSMRLCLQIESIAEHAKMAHLAGTFLLYCDCVRSSDVEKMSIVAAVTAGDADQLIVGRHGVFYDRKGDEWDAVVVRMIENPISVSEAFWSPYKRVGRLVASQLEKVASSRDKDVETKAATMLETAVKVPKPTEKAAPAAPFDIAKFAGIFAAMGLAVGALGTAIATVIAGFLALPLWEIPLVILGAVLLVSGPSMLLAWLKLRKRSLGPILDANGWAVNTHASISLPFGATLTKVAVLPAGSQRSLLDPFAQQSRSSWWWVLLLIVVFASAAGYWQWSETVHPLTAKEKVVVAKPDAASVTKPE